jgi:hypothetical protein
VYGGVGKSLQPIRVGKNPQLGPDLYNSICGGTMVRAIMTDSHFWLPLLVLVLGITLLMRLT